MKRSHYSASLPSRRRRRSSRRRSPAELAQLLAVIQGILDASELVMTIRHLFYRLVTRKIIEKTEQAYDALLKHLAKWRRAKSIDWASFSDSTRWYIRAASYESVHDALKRTRENYRRDMWVTQPYYPEVWVEKDAIAGLVAETAQSYGVPTFVCRGFSSLSGIYEASQTFKAVRENGKTPVILFLGDYDPSGQVEADFIERSLREDFGCDVDFRHVAVTAEQIEAFDLPTRPTKESSHSKNWTGGESVELDAMSTEQIQGVVKSAILDLIDVEEWQALRNIEEQERKSLQRIEARFRRPAA